MPEARTGDAVQLLDLLADYFADETRWLRGDLDNGRGRRCLVGAIHYLRRKHQIASGAAQGLLLEALPRGHCDLASFNDRCANIAELRALIANARTLAVVTADRRARRAAAAPPGRWRILAGLRRELAAAGDEGRPSEPKRLAA
jgi:hypothetical protein